MPNDRRPPSTHRPYIDSLHEVAVDELRVLDAEIDALSGKRTS